MHLDPVGCFSPEEGGNGNVPATRSYHVYNVLTIKVIKLLEPDLTSQSTYYVDV